MEGGSTGGGTAPREGGPVRWGENPPRVGARTPMIAMMQPSANNHGDNVPVFESCLLILAALASMVLERSGISGDVTSPRFFEFSTLISELQHEIVHSQYYETHHDTRRYHHVILPGSSGAIKI